MQEVQKIAYLLLKHNILKEKLRRFVLKLPSSVDVKEGQASNIKAMNMRSESKPQG